MQSLRLKILIFTNLICFGVFGQHYDFVKIIPGQGIVFNNDSIILGKTSIKEVCRIFKIKDNPNEIIVTEGTGFYEKTGESRSDTYYSREIIYKSITFTFGDENAQNYELVEIKAKEDKSLKIYTDNGLVIGMINPKLRELFPEISRRNYISKTSLTYNLFTYGISLELEKMTNDDLKLVEISTHRKFE